MADFSSQPDYGLDPSILSYIQGGQPLADAYMHDPRSNPPPPVAIAQDPNAPGIIHGGGPGPQQVMSEYNVPGAVIANLPPSPPLTPPPPAQHIGADYGIPAPVLAGIQSGFAPAPESAANVNIPAVTPTGGLPTAQQAPDVTPTKQTAPDVVAGTVAAPTDAQNQAYDKKQAAQAAFAASPEGQLEQSDAMKMKSVDEGTQAINDELAATTAQNDAVANAKQASQIRAAAQAKIDQEKEAQDQASADKLGTQWQQDVKDQANYKVNTNRDVGLGGMIAIALSGIGDALDHRHGPNAAAQILDNAIDKRIEDQWRQKDELGKKAEGTKAQMDYWRGKVGDDRTAQALHLASEKQSLADDLDQISAKFANPIAQARGKALAADQRVKAAAIVADAATRKIQEQRAAQDERDKQAQIGIAAGHLSLAGKQYDASRIDADRDYQLKLAELNQKGQTEAAKKLQAQQQAVQERGLPVPASVNPDGSVHYEYAKQEDGTPWSAPPGKPSEDLGTIQTATINGIKIYDDLRKARSNFTTNEQFDNWLSTNETGRALLQKQAQLILDIHKASGISRFTPEAVDLATKVATGGLDADSIKNVLDEMDTGRQMMIDNLDANMRGIGKYTGKPITFPDASKMPSREKDPIDKAIEGATSLGSAESHSASVAFGAGAGPVNMIQSAESGRRQGQVDDLVKAYGDASPEDRKRIMQGLSNIAAHAPDDTTRSRALAAQTSLATAGVP